MDVGEVILCAEKKKSVSKVNIIVDERNFFFLQISLLNDAHNQYHSITCLNVCSLIPPKR